ncbi:hypothetical protein P2318_17350 [Myxococcaceae bacterium GXIMD 01537]
MAAENDDFPPDPLLDDEQPGREGRAGFVPEFVRKVAVAGLGALFMTEEGIRSLAGQLKLPKEMLGFILSQAEKTKDDLGRVLSEELRRFLQSDKLRDELLKTLSGMTVEVKAQIRLVPSEPAPKSASKDKEKDKAPAAEPPGTKVVITELNARGGGHKRKKE